MPTIIRDNARKDTAFVLFLALGLQTVLPLAGLAGGYDDSAHHQRDNACHLELYKQQAVLNELFRKQEKENKKNKFQIVDKATILNGKSPGFRDDEEDVDGPSQPEMSQFKPVGSSNMVDLFTGDFSYNIPLLDVGGYPVNISYNGQIGMDQEASWAGLGWNINPGAITRGMRGMPDDFNGSDSIFRTTRMKPQTVVGGGITLTPEFGGFPVSIGFSLGAFYNSKTGWGVETGINPSINLAASSKANTNTKDSISIGVSIKGNSQEGLTLSPSFGYSTSSDPKTDNGLFSISTNYNSRAGLSSATVSATCTKAKEEVQQKSTSKDDKKSDDPGRKSFGESSTISFARSSIVPSISTPYTSLNANFTLGLGGAFFIAHVKGNLNGYFSRTRIDYDDQTQGKPAYGYLYYSNAQRSGNTSALLDMNRDKEAAYRQNPVNQNIAIPSYTYDAFNVNGEGIGGMFRAYRSDIGHTYDHYMTTKSQTVSAGLDLGFGVGGKWGGNISYARTQNTNQQWNFLNAARSKLQFTQKEGFYEPVYFRNPGELTVNDQAFYSKFGGDSLVKLNLEQPGGSISPIIWLNSKLDVYKNARINRTIPLTSVIKSDQRAKRTQVINYLTADEAVQAGKRFIMSYDTNYFNIGCTPDPDKIEYIDRVDNAVHKGHHISDIEVLNADGRRYDYSIPAYNYDNREITYSLRRNKQLNAAANIAYSSAEPDALGFRPTDEDDKSIDQYYSRQITPPYSHSFLLTGVYSPDYVDATGDGPSEDDLGDVVKMNYSRVYGGSKIGPYWWRTPFHPVNHSTTPGYYTYHYDIFHSHIIDSTYVPEVRIDSVNGNYEEGLKTDFRDDKASYIAGVKEVWYLNSIESKTMIATFWLEQRKDAASQSNELGGNNNNRQLNRLKEIRLYSKADLAKNGIDNAKPVKTVHFEYSYELCRGFPLNTNTDTNNNGKLTLKKIWFTYNKNDKGEQNTYIFHYRNNQRYQYQTSDSWGNYKDPTDNPGGLNNKDYPYPVNDISKAGKEDNIAPWALDSIQLPSGSSIRISYEADDYGFVQNKRAAQLFRVVKLGKTSTYSTADNRLYEGKEDANDHRYVFVKSPVAVSDKQDLFRKYLQGLDYLYFRMFIKVPDDPAFDINNGKYEFVKLYAKLDGDNYGVASGTDGKVIWFKVKGTDKKHSKTGEYSPLAKAAIQFLRNELPAKAFKGSQFPADQTLDVKTFATAFISAIGSIGELRSFHSKAKSKGYCQYFDTTRSFVRLDCPAYNKTGGGYRVRRIEILDNWKKMTGQKDAIYGQEYLYTTTRRINGKNASISSGVATYEPFVGGEENPFRIPIENYDEQTSPLGPVNALYTEGPLMESFYPAASVGYSRVLVRSVHNQNIKSLTGWDETKFYTSYDYPVFQDDACTPMSDGYKKFKSPLAGIIKFNVRKLKAYSQGFRIDMNDMNGKMRSQASYAHGDSIHPINQTEYFYKSVVSGSESKKLDNSALTIDTSGTITPSQIGKDVELMVDFRQQKSFMFSAGLNSNFHFFTIGIFPILIPAFLQMPQMETEIASAAAVTKIINRHGLLDSIISMDKGSVVSTRNLAYDAETGDVLVTRTNNEFDDPIYNVTTPAHWAYDRMGPAYKNIGVITNNVHITDGKISDTANNEPYFVPGDEVLATHYDDSYGDILWVTKTKSLASAGDTTYQNPVTGYPGAGPEYKGLRFVKRDGEFYTNTDVVSVKVLRSGRRNQASMPIGSITTLINPIIGNKLKIDSSFGVINATAVELKEDWKTQNQYWHIDSCNMICKCPPGYSLDGDHGGCRKIVNHPVVMQDTVPIGCSVVNSVYTADGVKIYKSFNLDGSATSSSAVDTVHVNHSYWSNPDGNTTDGKLNKIGLWLCDFVDFDGDWAPHDSAIGFVFHLDVPATKTYYVGLAGDNSVGFKVDCNTIVQFINDDNYSPPFQYWHVYPIQLTKGVHTFQLLGKNAFGPASFGAEIYNNTREEIIADSTGSSLDILFSTQNKIGSKFQIGDNYVTEPCDVGNCISIDEHGNLFCSEYLDTTAIYQRADKEIQEEDTLNPYVTGILGNYRPYRNYTFYTNRKEQDSAHLVTDIRRYGTIDTFHAFWAFQNNKLKPTYHNNWVWNSENTLYQRRGISVETRDPLGRYTMGQYGYNYTLPVAVSQNSKYRQSAFEGFEDYGYLSTPCVDTCEKSIKRHFDWSRYRSKIQSTEKHSGGYALGLSSGDTALVTCQLTDTISDANPLWLRLENNEIHTGASARLPVLQPQFGDSVIISGWVKESVPCITGIYSNVLIDVTFINGGTGSRLTIPSIYAEGLVIEGWQRIESVVTIPSVASGYTAMEVKLRSVGAGGTTAYFDDLRMHPYHANMKSFVYSPVSLRLMAELDENNYASFFEYDDDGTLIRVKKETERGIKTISETRSALLK